MVLRKVQAVKNVLCVYIPQAFAEMLNIQKGDTVDIRVKDSKITIEKSKPKELKT
jgi:antitoxin component of MazEF toxin-antitoxin module